MCRYWSELKGLEVNFKGEDDSWKHVYQPEKKAALTLTKLGNPVRETGL